MYLLSTKLIAVERKCKVQTVKVFFCRTYPYNVSQLFPCGQKAVT